jgi:hypothetical protein
MEQKELELIMKFLGKMARDISEIRVALSIQQTMAENEAKLFSKQGIFDPSMWDEYEEDSDGNV